MRFYMHHVMIYYGHLYSCDKISVQFCSVFVFRPWQLKSQMALFVIFSQPDFLEATNKC